MVEAVDRWAGRLTSPGQPSAGEYLVVHVLAAAKTSYTVPFWGRATGGCWWWAPSATMPAQTLPGANCRKVREGRAEGKGVSSNIDPILGCLGVYTTGHLSACGR
jgi:hypothetical protein